MNNEQLIIQIKQIIAALEQEQAKLQAGSKAYNSKTSAISAFSTALKQLNGEIVVSEQYLTRLSQKLENVLSGASGRVRLGGQRLRQGTYKSAVQEVKAEDSGFLPEGQTIESAYANKGRELPDVDAEKLAKRAQRENVALEKANATLEKAIKKRDLIVTKYNDVEARLNTLNQEAGIQDVVPAVPTLSAASDVTKSPKERLKAVNAEKELIEKAYADLKKRVVELESELNTAFTTRKREIKVEDDVISRTLKLRNEEIKKQLAERQKLISESGRSPQDELDKIASENAMPGDRFNEAVQGKEATNREYEDYLRAKGDVARQEAAYNQQFKTIRDQEAANEQLANERMRKLISDKKQQILEEQILAEKRAKIQNLERSLPGGAVAAQKLDKMAASIDPGFTRDTIKRVDIEGSSGVAKVQYQLTTAEGVYKRATFTVDKFGKVLEDVPRRLQGFTGQIARNIKESISWGLAIGLVYGSMQKLQEMVQLAIANQSALADIEVTLANATQSTNEVFSAAAQIAQETGESLDGVIEAYNLAYRATGGVSDSTERFTMANTLLKDAIILSKLSTLDQAEAIDTLSAALKQTGGDLDQGRALLDSWVKVTKVANVDLTTLATSFAVVGDAANKAQIPSEKLNAVIATIAESSISSGKEVANTARALISGFQSDTATKEMTMLGIAVNDATGAARPFLDVISDIRDLQKAGIIDDTQFSKLTLALGGGTRRQAAFSSFISNFDKIAKIEEASLNASGSAAAALDIKLQTVESGVTNLGSSFQELAQAVGESGGILDNFSMLLEILNSLTKGLADFMQVSGRAGPVLATAVAGLVALNSISGAKATLYSKVGDYASGLGTSYGLFTGQSLTQSAKTGQKFAGAAQTALPYAGAAAIVGSSAASNLLSGNTAEGIGNIIGGSAGTALGAFAAGPGGAIVGAALGSAIGEGFVNFAQSWKPTGAGLFESPINAPTKAEEDTKTETQKLEDRLIDELEKVVGSNTGAKGIDNFVNKLTVQLRNWSGSLAFGEDWKGLTDTQGLLIKLEERFSMGLVTQEDYNRIKSLLSEVYKEQNVVEEIQAPSAQTPALLADVRSQRESELRNLLQEGQVGMASYRSGMEQLGTFSSAAQQYYPVVGSQFGGEEDFYKTFSNIFARGKLENIEELNTLKQDIEDLTTELSNLTVGSEEYNVVSLKIANTTDALAGRIKELNNEILATAQLLDSVDFSNVGWMQGANPDQLIEEARQNYRQDLQEQVDVGQISVTEMEAVIANTADTLLKSLGLVAENVPSSYIQDVLNKWQDEGKISTEDQRKDLGFQTYDMTQGEYSEAMTKYEPLLKKLQSFGYVSDESDSINIFKDGISKDRKDWKVVQYLLQEILKTEEKQLDGVYNLPEGASFWVPYQAAKLAPEGGNSLIESLLQEIANNTSIAAKYASVDGTTPSSGEAYQIPVPVESQYPKTAAEDFNPYGTTSEQIKKFKEWEQQYPVRKENDFGYDTSLKGRGTNANYSDMESSNNPLSGLLSTSPAELLKQFIAINSAIKLPAMGAGSSVSATVQQGLTAQDLTSALAQVFSNLTTNFDLHIENKMTVQVDGKQMATVVKQYLKNDLLRYAGGGASKSATFI